MANKIAENALRIRIYEQNLVTGHPDVHPHAHADHVFLTDSLFSGLLCAKTKVKFKIIEHGFCVEYAHFNH